MLLHSLVSFFQPHKKNKAVKKEVVQTIPPPPPIPSSYLENNPSTSSVSEFPSHNIHQKVEFEQSRNLLQLDFFDKVDYNQIASFPKFDHLLASPSSNSTPPPPETQPEPQSTLSSLNRRLTTTLKHKISINRSHRDKAVKKAVSTPNFHNTQKK